MAMKALRDGASGGFTKFILFGFLVLATGGLVFMDMGGFFRGGITSTDVAKAGDETISLQEFDRNLRRSIARIGMLPEDAHRLGYTFQLLNGEIKGRLLKQAANRDGIVIGTEQIQQQTKSLIRPLLQPGQNPKDVFKNLLLNQGMSEPQFAAMLEREMTNVIAAGALQAGFASISDILAKDLYRHQNESRDISYFISHNNAIKSVEKPTEEQLTQLYNATKEQYAIPEYRHIKIIQIDNVKLQKTLEISEEEIRSEYDSNIDYYRTPASRTLEQALITDEEQAQKIYKKTKKGTALKESVSTVTGNAASYLGEKTFVESDILEAVRTEALAVTKKGALLEPIQSPIGWHIIIVQDIMPETVKPYKEVKDAIKADILGAIIIDQQYAVANTVDDLLASGAPLDDVIKTTDINVTDIGFINRFGGLQNDKEKASPIFETAKDLILELGFTLIEGETSAVTEAQNGQFIAVHIEKISNKSYKPFSEVRTAIEKRWMNDAKRAENTARVLSHLDTMKNKAISLADFAKKNGYTIHTKTGLKRTQDAPKPLSAMALKMIFEASINEPFALPLANGQAIATVTNHKWPVEKEFETKEFADFRDTLISDSKTDGITLYIERQREKYGASINEALLNRIYSPEEQAY